jgi:hypothetical protein
MPVWRRSRKTNESNWLLLDWPIVANHFAAEMLPAEAANVELLCSAKN